MKRLKTILIIFLLLFMTFWTYGAKRYQYPDNPQLNSEFENVYLEMKNADKVDGKHAADLIYKDGTILKETDNIKDVACHQGVATNGIYLYTVDSITIYKRQMDGTFISSHTNAHLDGTDMRQINHIHIYGNRLYIGLNNYDNTPKKGYIKVFDADDLSYIEEHQVQDHWSEGCAFHDDNWWVVYSDWKKVSRYDKDWKHIASYDLDYPTTGDEKINAYQGITWKDDDIFCTIHDTTHPFFTVDRYYWAGNKFVCKARLTAPINATQGICYYNNKFYIAQRNHPITGKHSVTITELSFPNIGARGKMKAYLGTTQQNISDRLFVKVALNQKTRDLGNDFDTTTHKFTVPLVGYYLIIANVRWTEVVADKRYYVTIYKDGSKLFQSGYHSSFVGDLNINTSDIVYLTKGSYIELYVWHNAGVDTVDIKSGAAETYMSIYLLSKD